MKTNLFFSFVVAAAVDLALTFCCCCWTPKGKFPPFQRNYLLRIANKRIFITNEQKNLFSYAFLIIFFLFIQHLWLNFTRLAYEWRLIENKQLASKYWDLHLDIIDAREFKQKLRNQFLKLNFISIKCIKCDKNLELNTVFDWLLSRV